MSDAMLSASTQSVKHVGQHNSSHCTKRDIYMSEMLCRSCGASHAFSIETASKFGLRLSPSRIVCLEKIYLPRWRKQCLHNGAAHLHESCRAFFPFAVSYMTRTMCWWHLQLLIWFFERGILEGRDEFLDNVDSGIAAKRLFRSLILIICAIFNGFLAFLLLAMNLRDVRLMPSTVETRWLFASGLGSLVANGSAAYIIYSAQKAYEWRIDDGSYEKPFPHYMIISVFALFMFVMNTMYIRIVYLPFIRCRPTGWKLVRRNLSLILELGRRERGETSFRENVRIARSSSPLANSVTSGDASFVTVATPSGWCLQLLRLLLLRIL